MTYADRVRELEAEGLDTSDAQGVADVEAMQGRASDRLLTVKALRPLQPAPVQFELQEQ